MIISLEEMKNYLRIDFDDDDALLENLILSLKATPLANGYVKAKTGDDTTDSVYQDWYKSVYLTSKTPVESEEQA